MKQNLVLGLTADASWTAFRLLFYMTGSDWFEKSEASHTLRKPGWIVVDVGQCDVDGGGP